MTATAKGALPYLLGFLTGPGNGRPRLKRIMQAFSEI